MEKSKEVGLCNSEEVLFVIKKETLKKYCFTILGIILLTVGYLNLFKPELILITSEKISTYFAPEKIVKEVEKTYQPRTYETMIRYISSIPNWNQELFEEIEIATEYSKMSENYQTVITAYENGDNFEELIKRVSEPDLEYDTEEGPFKIRTVSWRKRITEKSVIVITVSYENQSKQIVNKNYTWETL